MKDAVSRSQRLELVLRAAEREYDDLSKTFVALDGKAQNTIIAAGIFLAAITAFLDQARLQQYLQIGRCFALFFLGGAAVLLVGSIIASLLGMRIRRVPTPLNAGDLGRMVDDVLALHSSELNEPTHENFLRDQIEAWRGTLDGMAAVNGNKATAALVGQVLLVIAAVFLGVLLVARVVVARVGV
jgi:hypothetical protein